MYGGHCDDWTALKSLIREAPFTASIMAMIVWTVIFAQAVRVCEAPYVRIDNKIDFFDFGESLWSVFSAITRGKIRQKRKEQIKNIYSNSTEPFTLNNDLFEAFLILKKIEKVENF